VFCLREPENNVSQAAASSPVVWALLSHRAGETSQILALAEALSWPFERKVMHYRRSAGPIGLLRRSGVGGVAAEDRHMLSPPWPDLLISSGLRNEPVARWIVEQSGGRTRAVFIGRTWSSVHHFDLLVTTPQYRVPPGPNVLENSTTLQGVTEEKLAQAERDWRHRLDTLPRPHIAVIVGGNSGPYTLGANGGRRLALAVSRYASERGGSLLVSTSSRTGKRCVDQIGSTLFGHYDFFPWRRNTANPYFAYLSSADELIVTGDSIAMLSEACATRKPVFIYDFGRDTLAMRHPRGEPEKPGDWFHQDDFRLTGIFYWLMMKTGPRRLSRELRIVYERLIGDGRAAWFGDPAPDITPPPLGDVERTVNRVNAILRDRLRSSDRGR
jgi:mitochondrial fission protein ELM1